MAIPLSEQHDQAGVVSLREYVDIRFLSLGNELRAAMAASDLAVAKAEVSNEKRFSSVNEFRQTLTDRDRLNMPRTETEGLFRAMDDKIKQLFEANEHRRQTEYDSLSARLDINAQAIRSLNDNKEGGKENWSRILAVGGGLISLITLLLVFYRMSHS